MKDFTKIKLQSFLFFDLLWNTEKSIFRCEAFIRDTPGFIVFLFSDKMQNYKKKPKKYSNLPKKCFDLFFWLCVSNKFALPKWDKIRILTFFFAVWIRKIFRNGWCTSCRLEFSRSVGAAPSFLHYWLWFVSNFINFQGILKINQILVNKLQAKWRRKMKHFVVTETFILHNFVNPSFRNIWNQRKTSQWSKNTLEVFLIMNVCMPNKCLNILKIMLVSCSFIKLPSSWFSEPENASIS